MFSDQINAAQVGVPGDACTTCGSALSPDQRYCLSCGTRRSGANLHFQQILAAEAAAQAPAVSTAQAAGGAGAGGAAPRSSMPALASIACLLLALGVGAALHDRKWVFAAIAVAVPVACIGLYAMWLGSLGLPVLPSSVLSKSTLASGVVDGGGQVARGD